MDSTFDQHEPWQQLHELQEYKEHHEFAVARLAERLGKNFKTLGELADLIENHAKPVECGEYLYCPCCGNPI